MAVNFNQDSVWNLKPISVDAVRGEVNGILIGGEEVVMAFQTVRDQLLFTNKRSLRWTCRELPESGNPSAPCPIPKFSIFPSRPPALGS